MKKTIQVHKYSITFMLTLILVLTLGTTIMLLTIYTMIHDTEVDLRKSGQKSKKSVESRVVTCQAQTNM